MFGELMDYLHVFFVPFYNGVSQPTHPLFPPHRVSPDGDRRWRVDVLSESTPPAFDTKALA